MKISVVTPCWNSAGTVADTLRSVNAQTHTDVEHIVVDGGSTDATLEIVAAEGRRVARVVSERDEGIYDAMNKGIRLATGGAVGILNSDDFYASNDVLARVAERFADPSVDVVWGDLCYVDADRPQRIVRYWKSGPYVEGAFASGWVPPHPSVFIRRSRYLELGLYDHRRPVVADFELLARYIGRHRLAGAHIPSVLVHMRSGGASNGPLLNVVRQNREIWSILRGLGLARSPLAFAVAKAASRLRQFVRRPS